MRLIQPLIKKDLEKKMVFLSGPRQCGKTTLAKNLLKSESSGLYLNWDNVNDRVKILKGDWVDQDHLLVLDEIHKFKKWKNLIKGFYDKEKETHQFLVTGSARLDLYQKGGDSLLGRYHRWRLHPFSLYDLPKGISAKEGLSRLMSVGGFPEVFLDNDERKARRWRAERSRLIIKEDVRDLEQIQNLDILEVFVQHLKERVGSTLAISNLAQEIGVSQPTATKWLKILEKMYVIFIVQGYDKKITRAVHKPIKIYFYDNAEVEFDEAARFENLVANHLLQRNHYLEDYHGYRMGLYYAKNKNQKEVDFLITQNNQIKELIEVKLSDDKLAPSLLYFAQQLAVPKAIQIVLNLEKSWSKGKLFVQNPIDFCSTKLDSIESL